MTKMLAYESTSPVGRNVTLFTYDDKAELVFFEDMALFGVFREKKEDYHNEEPLFLGTTHGFVYWRTGLE